MRSDATARRRVSESLDIDSDWAIVSQVHGADVIRVEVPGPAGEADALWTQRQRLPIAVFTADCLGIVIRSPAAVGVAHAGWRGVEAGVVSRLRDQMAGAGEEPTIAHLGPGIGPCCFEVGPDVLGRFAGSASETSWGTDSVDLVGALGDQLVGLEVWSAGSCTMHDDGWFSHRRDATPERLASIGWIP